MGTIANLAVALTANIGGFNAPMIVASRTVTAIRAGFSKATDSAAAFERAMNEAGKVKIAGTESIQSLRAALATARGEINRFASGHDVQVLIEVSREFLDESWIKAKSALDKLVEKSGLKVAAKVISDKAQSVRAWLSRQQKVLLTDQLKLFLHFNAMGATAGIAAVKAKLESLKQYRAIRILLAATNSISPIARAALSTLRPLLRLAGHGIMVAVHLSHAGISAGVNKATTAIKGLASVGSGVASKIISSFTGIGAALAALAGGVGLTILIKDQFEAIASTGRLSDRLGIATEKLGGIQYAAKLAGIDSEALSTGLEHMLKNLSEADDKGGPAADAIALIGLNAAKLKNESPDQAFSEIADGLTAIKNPADRGRAAMDLFGKSGQQLLPLLMQGSQGIAAATEEAKKLGLSFNRVDAAKVEAANQAFVRLQAVITGAAQTLAIQLSPFIEAATNKLVAFATSGKGAGAYVVDAFEWIVKSVASLSDYLALVEGGWHLMQASSAYAIGGILNGIAYLIDGINKLTAHLHIAAIGGAEALHELGKAFVDTGNDAFAAAGENWQQFTDGTNSKAASKLFDDIRANADKDAKAIAANSAAMNAGGIATDGFAEKLEKAQQDAKKITDTLDELDKSIATFGQTDDQKKLFDLKQLGASPEQLAAAQAKIDQLSKLDNAKKATDALAGLQKEISQFNLTDTQKKLADLKLPGVDQSTLDSIKSMTDHLDAMKEASKVFDETRTPMEQYESKIGKLSDLLNEGAINWDTYSRAVRAAREQLEKATQVNPQQLLLSGSAAAQQFEYTMKHQAAFDNTVGAQKSNPANKNDELPKMQLSETQQSRRVLERIENVLIDSSTETTEVVQI